MALSVVRLTKPRRLLFSRCSAHKMSITSYPIVLFSQSKQNRILASCRRRIFLISGSFLRRRNSPTLTDKKSAPIVCKLIRRRQYTSAHVDLCTRRCSVDSQEGFGSTLSKVIDTTPSANNVSVYPRVVFILFWVFLLLVFISASIFLSFLCFHSAYLSV